AALLLRVDPFCSTRSACRVHRAVQARSWPMQTPCAAHPGTRQVEACSRDKKCDIRRRTSRTSITEGIMARSRRPGRPRKTGARRTTRRKAATRKTAAGRKMATRVTAPRKTGGRKTVARRTPNGRRRRAVENGTPVPPSTEPKPEEFPSEDMQRQELPSEEL